MARAKGVPGRCGFWRGRPGLSGYADRTDRSAGGDAAGLFACLPGCRRVLAGGAVRAVVGISNGYV